MTWGSVITAMTAHFPEHRGHSKTSSSNTWRHQVRPAQMPLSQGCRAALSGDEVDIFQLDAVPEPHDQLTRPGADCDAPSQ